MMQEPISTGRRLENKTTTGIAKGERLRMLGDRILVKPIPPKLSETIIADWRGQVLRGTVIAVGPGEHPNIHWKGKKDGKDVRTVRRSHAFRKTEVRPGDIVELGGKEIGGYLWTTILVNGIEHVLATEKDVAGIVTEA